MPYATAWRELFQKAYLAPAETVLVHGASGGVGVAAVQMAAAHGCIVIGTAAPNRANLCGAKASTSVFHHRAAHYGDEIVGVFTGGRGVRRPGVLANVNLERSLGVLATRGRRRRHRQPGLPGVQPED